MINHLLYIVGAPGSGKSTLARELRRGWDQEVVRTGPVPHTVLRHPSSGIAVGLELGVPRPEFPGTDALAMDIGPRAGEFLRRAVVPFALGEGSRLATRPFLGGLVQAGVRVTVVSLCASQDVLDERWRARGGKQNPAWRKGAATRAERITDWAVNTLGVSVLSLHTAAWGPQGLADLVRIEFPLLDLGDSEA
jgi:GTPase SAR1 family protein